MHCSDASTHSLHKAIIVPLLFKPAIRRSWPSYQGKALFGSRMASKMAQGIKDRKDLVVCRARMYRLAFSILIG